MVSLVWHSMSSDHFNGMIFNLILESVPNLKLGAYVGINNGHTHVWLNQQLRIKLYMLLITILLAWLIFFNFFTLHSAEFSVYTLWGGYLRWRYFILLMDIWDGDVIYCSYKYLYLLGIFSCYHFSCPWGAFIWLSRQHLESQPLQLCSSSTMHHG